MANLDRYYSSMKEVRDYLEKRLEVPHIKYYNYDNTLRVFLIYFGEINFHRKLCFFSMK